MVPPRPIDLAARLVPPPPVVRYARSWVPTEFGELLMVVYRETQGDQIVEHVAIVGGDIEGKRGVLVRVHSECMTSEVFHSLKCDCREQLHLAMRRVAREGGAIVYLRQEGRGIGLGNKLRAYALQAQGVDTVDANRLLGFADDLRRYDVAADILRDLGVASVRLMTNNPAKVSSLRAAGVQVDARVPSRIPSNIHNRAYLVTKRDRMGHQIDDGVVAANSGETATDGPRQ